MEFNIPQVVNAESRRPNATGVMKIPQDALKVSCKQWRQIQDKISGGNNAM